MKKCSLLFICFVLLLVSGCDWSLEYYQMEITTYPKRIVYWANEDNTLDLSGGEITLTTYEKTKTSNIPSDHAITSPARPSYLGGG